MPAPFWRSWWLGKFQQPIQDRDSGIGGSCGKEGCLSRSKVGKTKSLHVLYGKQNCGSFVAIGRESDFEDCSAGDVRPGFHRPSQSQVAFMPAVSHHAVVEADSSNATVRETRLLVPVRGMAALLGVLADALSSRQFHVRSLQAQPLAPAYQQLHFSPITTPA